MSVGRPKMKRDAGVKAVFLLRKKTAFTPVSLFILGRRTDVTPLVDLRLKSKVASKEKQMMPLLIFFLFAQNEYR